MRVIEPRQFDSRAARASERAPVLGRLIAASDATSMAGRFGLQSRQGARRQAGSTFLRISE
jgi:hypothetical protein